MEGNGPHFHQIPDSSVSNRELRCYTEGKEPCSQTLSLGEPEFHNITRCVCVCVCKSWKSQVKDVGVCSHSPEGFWDISKSAGVSDRAPRLLRKFLRGTGVVLTRRVQIHPHQGVLHEQLSQKAWYMLKQLVFGAYLTRYLALECSKNRLFFCLCFWK